EQLRVELEAFDQLRGGARIERRELNDQRIEPRIAPGGARLAGDAPDRLLELETVDDAGGFRVRRAARRECAGRRYRRCGARRRRIRLDDADGRGGDGLVAAEVCDRPCRGAPRDGPYRNKPKR